MLRSFVNHFSRNIIHRTTTRPALYRPSTTLFRPLSTLRVRDALSFRQHNVEDENAFEIVEVRGWVRTVRKQKHNIFIEVNDGSSFANLQIVMETNDEKQTLEFPESLTTGCSIVARGKLVKSIKNSNVNELLIDSHHVDHDGSATLGVRVVGVCDPETYPLQKKRHSPEFMREIAHLRPRSNTTAAMIRVRNACSMAVNEYFQNHYFYLIHAPILTSSDCEGAGEMFQVICNSHHHDENDRQKKTKKHGKIEKVENEEQKRIIIEGYISKSELENMKTGFFGTEAFLTVSAQLQAEIFASAMSRVYTFGPTFRAEMSKTNRHLAEFWMVEMEQAFADLNELMGHGEGLIKHCVKRVMERCEDDLQFFQKFYDKGLLERLQHTLDQPFKFITYTEAIEVLQRSGAKFQFPVEWGCNLQSEHEIYLSEQHFNGTPVFIVNYPRDIKPFYARVDEESHEDRKTVAAVDLVVPRLGELIGGSVREERTDVLIENMQLKGMDNIEDYKWYIDLRKYGSVPHGGFGLGFERLMMFLTGLDNIKDVIPVPRATSHLLY